MNKFKDALHATSQRPLIGCWVGLGNAYCAELVATAPFDWLLIDGEHAPNDVRSILGQLQAVAPYSPQPVVRPVSGDLNLIKQLLDIGAQTLMIPMVETGEQAAAMVAATRYPKAGVRGVGSALARASRWNLDRNYMQHAADGICLIVQVESANALRHLEQIAAVDGVDAIFIGPADLAASMGHLGDMQHPEVRAVIEDAIVRLRKTGKAVGILALEETAAKRYIELGCRFVAVGVDAMLLAQATRDLAKRFGLG